jgi:3-hydroxyisobutyrate dehydrogenase-like beta-hydroxyacid dehydrogenase
MNRRERIGVIGLGSMGRPIGRNLTASGYRVSGYDISPAAMAAAANDGVEPADSPAELAEQCDLVLTMVWDDNALRSAVFGSRGLLEAAGRLPPCTIDLSTTSVAVAREVGQAIAAGGAAFLDGAVIGGGVAAMTAGKSPLVLSGDRDVYERYLPVLASLGSCDYVGTLGNAKIVKIINNLLVGVVTASNAEALSLGVAMGLELHNLVHWLSQGLGGARVLESYMGRYVLEGIYGEGLIGHRLMAKDLQLAAELAESLGCPVAYPRFAQQMYLAFGRELGAHRPFPSAFDYFRRSNGGERCELRETTQTS